jgi:hypothetical protein
MVLGTTMVISSEGWWLTPQESFEEQLSQAAERVVLIQAFSGVACVTIPSSVIMICSFSMGG